MLGGEELHEIRVMPKSRIELHQLLLKLEKYVPALIAKYPDEQNFRSAFASEENIITWQAAPEGSPWLHGQIGCILDEYNRLHEIHDGLSRKH